MGDTAFLTDSFIEQIEEPRFKAFYLAYVGRSEEVIKYLDGLCNSRSNIDPSEDEEWYWRDIIDLESAIAVEHRRWAERVLTRFSNSRVKTSGVYLTTCVPRHLGAASTLLERYDDARDHYNEAIRVCTEMPFRPELALSRFQLAELQFEHFPEERTEALKLLEFAITEFEEMKMKPSLKRALELKDRLDAS